MSEVLVMRFAELAAQVEAWRGLELEVILGRDQSYIYATIDGDSGHTVLDTEGDVDALERALVALSGAEVRATTVLKELESTIAEFGETDLKAAVSAIGEIIGQYEHAERQRRQGRHRLHLVEPR